MVYTSIACLRILFCTFSLIVSPLLAGTTAVLAQGAATPDEGNPLAGAGGSNATFSPKLPDGRQRAFPSAEGFGAAAEGGRGGTVIYVTNLNDSGAGSLRACVEASGPRTCIFRVGGTITALSPIQVRDPFITIAGQTAPGGGIAIKNGPDNGEAPLQTLTHDVIVRHIRLRPGPGAVSCCLNALGVFKGTEDVIFDHLSMSWGVDQNIATWKGSRDYTIQWSIISEPLFNGPHLNHRGNRSRTIHIEWSTNVSFHHNLIAHTSYRNPLVIPAGGVTDIVNNVNYNAARAVIALSNKHARVEANVVGNYDILGPTSLFWEQNNATSLLADGYLVSLVQQGGPQNGFAVYLDDNYSEPRLTSASQPDTDAVYPGFFTGEDLTSDPAWQQAIASARLPAPQVHTTSPLAAYDAVLAGAGATKPQRDTTDARIVQETRTRTGNVQLVQLHPNEVGGWPTLADATPYADDDQDGMADDWERAHKLNASDAADGNQDRNDDGWTNLEEFINELAGG
jgi:pectate lyase